MEALPWIPKGGLPSEAVVVTLPMLFLVWFRSLMPIADSRLIVLAPQGSHLRNQGLLRRSAPIGVVHLLLVAHAAHSREDRWVTLVFRFTHTLPDPARLGVQRGGDLGDTIALALLAAGEHLLWSSSAS